MGQVVVATEQPNERVVIEVIRELGLELQVIFNKGSVMVLPSSVNKASGLQAALDEFSLSPHNVVGIGDAENDHAFLSVCECGVAVANALDAVKQRADHVTEGRASAGVREVIEALISNDLHALEAATLRRHSILLGHAGDDPVVLSPYGSGVLLAGPSGGGKSSLARGFLERLADQRYQFCIVDPEGDYDNFAVAVTIGTPDRRAIKRGPAASAKTTPAGTVLFTASVRTKTWPSTSSDSGFRSAPNSSSSSSLACTSCELEPAGLTGWWWTRLITFFLRRGGRSTSRCPRRSPARY